MIRYGSVCSGVEAATLAWKPLGWECVFVSEVEPFPCAVLQHRLGASRPIHPLDPAETDDEKAATERRAWMKQNEKLRADGVIPNEGDFTKIGDKYRGKIDLLVGGTPCFPAGNLVLTDFGYKPIEDIKVGDRVISHLDRLCRVVRTGSKIADNVGIMKATNNVDDIFISATANHPFLVGNSELFDLADAEFKPIAECVGRYAARLPSNGKYTGFRIEYFEPTNQPQTVYNIEVENDHSYIVNGLCVHNCQDLSVAGLRAGFEGERSVLAIDFVRLAYQSNCRWFVWENVPGVFSSNGGGDFATLLSLFTGCEIRVPEQGFGSAGFVCNARRDRFGVAWRVLDAQYVRVPGSFPYGIPQRRRRCFVVGYLGDWRRAAEVLLEPQCMSWPAPTRRKTRKAVAGSPGGCVEDASAIRMRSGCEGGGKGALVGRELSHTLATGNDQTIVTIGLGRDVIKSGENSKFSFSIIENAQPTLTARGEGGVCIKNDAICDTVISLASGQGGEWGCLGVNVAQTLSLNNGGFHYIACYENHANDSRVTFSGSVCPALTSRAGTGGGNLPLVMSSSELCFDVGNGQVDCSMHPLYECATTLHCMHDANAVMCVPINSMIIGKDVTLTDRQTIGIGDDGDALPTIGANHHHAVACSQYGEIAGTLTARYDSSPCIDRGQTVVASFMGGQGAAAGGIGYRKELSPTIKASPSGGNTVPDVMVASPHFELVACAIAENVINRKVQNGGNGVGAKYEVAYTLDTAGVQGVAVDVVDKQGQFMSDVVPCLTATSFKEAPSVNAFGYVRRLLPVECERLMGFPDNHTRIPWNGRSELECPDGPRYKACGNSFCVNVVRWIGEQIERVDKMKDEADA